MDNGLVKMTDYIKSQLTDKEFLYQLAEEASELSGACLHLCRAMDDSKNPTAWRRIDAEDAVKTELNDVLIVASMIPELTNLSFADTTETPQYASRIDRWYRRLKLLEAQEDFDRNEGKGYDI